MAQTVRTGSELQRLIDLLAKLPGLGPRSGRRVALALIKRRESLMLPLVAALEEAARTINPCSVCGNLDTRDPCAICADPRRDTGLICVVEDVGDVWALERAGVFKGLYHVLGGTLSAIDGIGPEELRIPRLMARLEAGVREVILALPATMDGQATLHLIADRFSALPVRLTRLAQGVPIGGELDYLDEGTLSAAMESRRSV